MTRKERILRILRRSQVGLTCATITKRVAKSEKLDPSGSVYYYLSRSVSSTLRKLVIEKKIYILAAKGPRGGNVYFK